MHVLMKMKLHYTGTFAIFFDIYIFIYIYRIPKYIWASLAVEKYSKNRGNGPIL